MLNALGFDDDLMYDTRQALESLPRKFNGPKMLREAAKTRALRTKLAASSHIPQTKEKYGITKSHESELAETINGSTSNNQNEPFDVYAGKHAIEVKTINESGHDRITMHPKSLKVKLQAAKKGGFTPHTVVFDTRKGKEAVYYREGLGSFRLAQMKKLPSIEAIREALGLEEVIHKAGKGFQVRSEHGKNLSKPGLSKGQAKKRLAQVEYFKHKEGGPGSGPRKQQGGDEEKSEKKPSVSPIEMSHKVVQDYEDKIGRQVIGRGRIMAHLQDRARDAYDGNKEFRDDIEGPHGRQALEDFMTGWMKSMLNVSDKKESRESVRRKMRHFLSEASSSSLKEAGVKGMKWGVKGDKPSVTILVGTNGAGKTTLMKGFVQRYNGQPMDVDGKKLTVVDRKGDKAIVMGHYTDPKFLAGQAQDENGRPTYRNSGKLRKSGDLYPAIDKVMEKAKDMNIKSVILDSHQFAFGKGFKEAIDYCKDKGIPVQCVRIKAPLDLIVQRVAQRIDPGHTRDRTLQDIAHQHVKVKGAYNAIKSGGWKVLKINNGPKTNPKWMAKKMGNFIFKGVSHSESSTPSRPNLREGGPGSGPREHGGSKKKFKIKDLKKGAMVKVLGETVVIENPKLGYGYFKSYASADGGGLDVFVGKNFNQEDPGKIRVFYTSKESGGKTIVEPKVMIGFESKSDAKEAFGKKYSMDRILFKKKFNADEFKNQLEGDELAYPPEADKYRKGLRTSSIRSKPNLREHGGDGTIMHPLDSGEYIPMQTGGQHRRKSPYSEQRTVNGEVHNNPGMMEAAYV